MTTIEKLKEEIDNMNERWGKDKLLMMKMGKRIHDLRLELKKARLSQHTEDVEEFNKNIDEFLNKLIKQQTSETPMLSDIEWEEGYNTGVRDIISFVLDYFKSSLEKDYEKEIEGNSK